MKVLLHKRWVVEWRAEEGLKCKRFYTEKEANDLADELFILYPVRVYYAKREEEDL